ncbi:hypothetical protein VULLAG_LOCUS3674 [Vulpes lagopus]
MLPPPGPAVVAQLVTEGRSPSLSLLFQEAPHPGAPGRPHPRHAGTDGSGVYGPCTCFLVSNQEGPGLREGKVTQQGGPRWGAMVLLGPCGTEPPLPRPLGSHQSPQPLRRPPPRRRLPHPPLLLCVPSRPWTPWGCHAPLKASASTALAGTHKVSPETSRFLRTNEGSNQTPPLEAQGSRLWDLEAGSPGQTGSLCSPRWGWGRKDRDPATSETPGAQSKGGPRQP